MTIVTDFIDSQILMLSDLKYGRRRIGRIERFSNPLDPGPL